MTSGSAGSIDGPPALRASINKPSVPGGALALPDTPMILGKSLSTALTALSALAATIGAAAATDVDPIEIKGNAFYYKTNGTRFYIKGVAYQPGGSSNWTDPLVDDLSDCERDIPYFRELGLNTIRVYSVDNAAGHDKCMNALAEAGIYLLLDVNTPSVSLNRADPSGSYSQAYLQNVFATIDAFSNYTNVLGFFAANEVINNVNTSVTAPYVKAVVRDMKDYIAAQSDRAIPVGYSAADIAENIVQQGEYFNCGNTSEALIDFYGINDYSWCDPSSFTTSGYSELPDEFENLGVPLFFSEYGCNQNRPRAFNEVQSIYSDDLSMVLSGGLVYEYSEEANEYGLVSIIDKTSVSTLGDFTNLKSQLAKVTLPTGSGDAATAAATATCPTFASSSWLVSDTAIPAMPSGASAYLKSGAGSPLGSKLTLYDGYAASTGSASGASSSGGASSSSSGASSARASATSASASSSSSSSSSSSRSSSAGAASLAVPGLVGLLSFMMALL